MRIILIFNDNSEEARHAAEFVLAMAQKVQANLLLANTYVKVHAPLTSPVTAGLVVNEGISDINEANIPDLLGYLTALNLNTALFKPEIFETDISNMNEAKVAELININNIWMIIKGIPDVSVKAKDQKNLNVHTILNKVLCPLLLIPSVWPVKAMERLVYIADLRYCRIQIVRYLAEVAHAWDADLLIAHLSAKGLPDMSESYALTVFDEEICRNVNYENLYFNNIRERDLKTAVDVLINGMRNDLLVVVNHRFHFEEIVGPYIEDNLPVHITVPILIFPF